MQRERVLAKGWFLEVHLGACQQAVVLLREPTLAATHGMGLISVYLCLPTLVRSGPEL